MPRYVLTLFFLFTGCQTTLVRQLTQADGRKVEYATAGKEGPVVVFEAGHGSDWTVWDAVAGPVAQRARVFAYARPGYAGSAAATTPRDPRHIVEELRGLLSAQGYAPPYVLVGHSFGGGYMEYFAKAYPSEVAALVLVDPRHRDFGTACESAGFSACGIPASALSSLPAHERDEVKGYDAASEEIAAAGPFGSFPVRVLVATEHSGGAEREALWESLLTSLAEEAADGEALRIEGAGHNLHLERPEDVARAVISVLPEVRQ